MVTETVTAMEAAAAGLVAVDGTAAVSEVAAAASGVAALVAGAAA